MYNQGDKPPGRTIEILPLTGAAKFYSPTFVDIEESFPAPDSWRKIQPIIDQLAPLLGSDPAQTTDPNPAHAMRVFIRNRMLRQNWNGRSPYLPALIEHFQNRARYLSGSESTKNEAIQFRTGVDRLRSILRAESRRLTQVGGRPKEQFQVHKDLAIKIRAEQSQKDFAKLLRISPSRVQEAETRGVMTPRTLSRYSRTAVAKLLNIKRENLVKQPESIAAKT